jgi:hypothetical protein
MTATLTSNNTISKKPLWSGLLREKKYLVSPKNHGIFLTKACLLALICSQTHTYVK